MGIPKGPELLIILALVLLLFGARKLPDLARSIGQSAKEFRKGVESGADEPDETSTRSSAPVTGDESHPKG
jgi:sec-independent protein translocase protein TatA